MPDPTPHLPPSEIERLRGLHEKATPVPWGTEDETNDHCMVTAGTDEAGCYRYVADVWEEADLALIPPMRNALPALLSAASRAADLERENERLKRELRGWKFDAHNRPGDGLCMTEEDHCRCPDCMEYRLTLHPGRAAGVEGQP